MKEYPSIDRTVIGETVYAFDKLFLNLQEDARQF